MYTGYMNKENILPTPAELGRRRAAAAAKGKGKGAAVAPPVVFENLVPKAPPAVFRNQVPQAPPKAAPRGAEGAHKEEG